MTEQEITFRLTDIQSGVLTEEMAEQLRAQFAKAGCQTFWGSHGCGLRRHHEGDHRCLDDDGELCCEVDRDGRDPGGFQWHMYGAGTVEWTP